VTSTPTASSTASSLSQIKRSKPLKYAYEKEIVLYAHHKNLDYFSTECIYSPEAFRGSARSLIKNLERIRPSAILDIVRSGEDMARLCPGYRESCQNGCGSAMPQTLEEETGCGSANGRSTGGEMSSMEQLLAQATIADVKSGPTELDFTSSLTSATTSSSRPSKPKQLPPKAVVGTCESCGYMSSQKICKACVLLKGLNKSRPKADIAV